MKITIKHYVLRKVVRLLNFLLRHCEIPPAESWQSITLPINKDSIVKVLDMLDYGLLRYARNDGGSGYFVIAIKFKKFSWQSITLPINKDSIVKVLDMLDYGLLRYARNDGGVGRNDEIQQKARNNAQQELECIR